MPTDAPAELANVVLYAWVGEDEFNSGAVGLKQALGPGGLVPLVCTAGDLAKIKPPYLQEQLRRQAAAFGKTISLCRFKFDGVVSTIEPQEDQ